MIRVEGLWKKFGRHEALKGLTFNVPATSAYALIGANGAGKTTTIKTIMNILTPSRGSIRTLGVDSRRLSPQELAQIGYVSESQDLPGGLTVDQYLTYLRVFYPKWDKDLELVMRRQLRLPADRKIRDLSHGMRIKVALVGALAFRPKLLVLDEPFSGLDPLVREEFMQQMISEAGGMTVLISSHELGEIEGVATHIGFIDEGKLLFQEPMQDLADRFRQVRITLNEEAVVPAGIPGDWLQLQAAGPVIDFVDTRYAEATLGERAHSLFHGVRRIDAEPMTLRAIFTTLARSARDGGL